MFKTNIPMKKYFPIFLILIFSSLILITSCKDKKAVNEKTVKPVAVKKETPKVVKPVKKVTPAPPPKAVVKKVIVKEGEWLCSISRREYGNLGGWVKIYNANKALINNPDIIYPNQELVIPE